MKKVSILFLVPALFFLLSCGESTGNGGGEELLEAEGKEYALPSEEMIRDKCAASRPKTMRDLSGGMKKLYYQLTKDNSASLNVFGAGKLNLGKKELLIIVDFVQYKNTKCDGEELRYGVGARLFLHVKKAGRGLKTTDLPHLAAGVQLGQASITYSIETIGITGQKISAVLPGTGSFDVEAYAKVISAVDEIQRLARDGQEGVIIDPQVIPVNAD